MEFIANAGEESAEAITTHTKPAIPTTARSGAVMVGEAEAAAATGTEAAIIRERVITSGGKAAGDGTKILTPTFWDYLRIVKQTH